jgi:hypothetical protein
VGQAAAQPAAAPVEDVQLPHAPPLLVAVTMAACVNAQ